MVLSAASFEEFGAICPVPEAGGLGALQAPLDLLGQRSGGGGGEVPPRSPPEITCPPGTKELPWPRGHHFSWTSQASLAKPAAGQQEFQGRKQGSPPLPTLPRPFFLWGPLGAP